MQLRGMGGREIFDMDPLCLRPSPSFSLEGEGQSTFVEGQEGTALRTEYSQRLGFIIS
jgi:hypothetical protein